jgi:hypothetical protein
MYLLTSEHEVRTAQQMNWTEKKNGVLLSLVEPDFDVFLTVDRNIKYQQNLSRHSLRFVILIGNDNRYETLAPLIPKVKETLLTIAPGELIEITL